MEDLNGYEIHMLSEVGLILPPPPPKESNIKECNCAVSKSNVGEMFGSRATTTNYGFNLPVLVALGLI